MTGVHFHRRVDSNPNLYQEQTGGSFAVWKGSQLVTEDNIERTEENDSTSPSTPTTTLHSSISSIGTSDLLNLAEMKGLDKNSSPSFQARLFDTLKRTLGHEERKGFFPQSAFADIVTEEVVAEELRRCCSGLDTSTTRQLSYTICGPKSFRRIFTLLVLVDRLSDIALFINEDVSDCDLPLGKIPYHDSNLFQLSRTGHTHDPPQPLSCFNSWDTVAVWSFEEWQWTTLAPFFKSGKNKNVKHFILPDQIPLPFTQDSRYGVDFKAIQGGFSTVSTVQIHPAHHNFKNTEVGYPASNRPDNLTMASLLTSWLGQRSDSVFAIKRLNTQDRAQFKREVDMLMTFSDNAHPHLISLLATYEQFSTFHLIFPLAEADLQSYWKEKNPRPSMDHDTVLWVAQQCYGISSGLSRIHRHKTVNFNRLNDGDFQQISHDSGVHSLTNTGHVWQLQLYGRHGDIKPQNVLWFRDSSNTSDRGVLRITDFGLAEFKTSTRNIYKPSNRTTVSAPYRSPECDMVGGSVGQSHDIWALGCLYLEFIAWLLGGWILVDEFKKARKRSEPTDYYDRISDGVFFDIQRGSQDGQAVPVIKLAVSKVKRTSQRPQTWDQEY